MFHKRDVSRKRRGVLHRKQISWRLLHASRAEASGCAFMSLSLEELGRLVAQKRGSRGVRAAALDVNISPATLSRVENGHVPDLVTFAKICRWLERDPREFLGFESAPAGQGGVSVHFRKKKTVSKETAIALGELILAAQDAMMARSSVNE